MRTLFEKTMFIGLVMALSLTSVIRAEQLPSYIILPQPADVKKLEWIVGGVVTEYGSWSVPPHEFYPKSGCTSFNTTSYEPPGSFRVNEDGKLVFSGLESNGGCCLWNFRSGGMHTTPALRNILDSKPIPSAKLAQFEGANTTGSVMQNVGNWVSLLGAAGMVYGIVKLNSPDSVKTWPAIVLLSGIGGMAVGFTTNRIGMAVQVGSYGILRRAVNIFNKEQRE
ncbi:MAG: hypothetical protein NTX53_03600 [candidate division WOR-3 bacterium]|nr:hypothetical protein [candidate division WOR-3 bacterium]